MTYDEKAFNEQLNENMADDPYGTATYLISEALKGAAQYNGTMNETEARNLFLIAHAVASIDTSRAVHLPTASDFGIDIEPEDLP